MEQKAAKMVNLKRPYIKCYRFCQRGYFYTYITKEGVLQFSVPKQGLFMGNYVVKTGEMGKFKIILTKCY